MASHSAPDSDEGLTILLLGKTGVGKSASGNTILGCQAFESRPSFKSVTKKFTKATETVFGKQITVIDTPGIFECEATIKTYCEELLQSSSPCLFLVVVSVGRFTDEPRRALQTSMDVLGEDGLEKSCILFTNGELLRGMSLDDFIFEEEDGLLPDIVKKFTGKYHLFMNEKGGEEQVRDLLIKLGHLQGPHQPAAGSAESNSLEQTRIMLLGVPGSGKSASGNTILGSDYFVSDCNFDSVSSEAACKSAEVEGRVVTVIDTPGFSDEVLSHEQLYLEIMESIPMECPGLHAIIIVVKLGRMSRVDSALLGLLPKLFGPDAMKYAMILFTHGDELGGRSINQKIQSNQQVSDLVSMCGGRFCVFDNKGRKSRKQVQNFLNKVDGMVSANEGKPFSSDMFKMANTFMAQAERTQTSEPAEARRRNARRRLRRFLQWRFEKIHRFFKACFRGQHSSDKDDGMPLLSRDQSSSHQEEHL